MVCVKIVNFGESREFTRETHAKRDECQCLAALFACHNRPFPSSKKSHFQSEAKCEAIDMKMIFNYYANISHFHNKGFALSLVLKVRFFGTRKWPIGELARTIKGQCHGGLVHLFIMPITRPNSLGSKGGAVVRAFASYQCGPGSNPGVNATCGLSLLLALFLALRCFSLGTSVFPSP